MKAEEEFWEYVKRDEEPPVDGHVATEETLGELYPTSSEVNVDLTSFEKDVEEYFTLGEQIAELEALRREKANKIKDYMGEAEKGEGDTFRVSYKSSARETFDSKAYRKDFPNFNYSKYLKKSTSRTFKITTKEN